MQEALLAAALQWGKDGVANSPRSWLVTVASRRLVDDWRSERARREREQSTAALDLSEDARLPHPDDTLTLLFLCCHPSLTVPSQLALTLRAVAGLSTTQIAKAFLVPEATMAQRISRAKQRIKGAGGRFDLPPKRNGLAASALSCMCCICSSTRATPQVRGVECTGSISPARPSG